MKYLFSILAIVGIISCNNEKQRFEPIESLAELSDKQIDSILTKFSFSFKYEQAILIDSTNQIIIPISTELLERKFSKNAYYSKDFARYWNVLFYNKLTGQTRLLTHEKTRISRIYTNHPNRKKEESKRMKSKILYELTQTDYNEDGRLNSLDPEFLYASNLNGDQLVQISPDKEDLKYFDVMPNADQIILRTLRDTNQDSIFNQEDESILYKAELIENEWELREIIDSSKRNEIKNLYFKQWLIKSE